MTKTELIDAMASQASLTKKAAGEAFNALFDEIAKSLGKGEEVSILGFGSFKLGQRAARTGRNPQTGEALKIKASTSVRFTAGKSLKDTVNKKKK
jgi:DNA-binding protein HU-beta